MKDYRLLIADADTLYTDALRRYLKEHTDFDVVGVTGNGIEALSMVHALKPDMLLLELMLPGMDGVTLLRELQNMKQPPVSVCLSEFYSSASVDAVRRNGASYYIFKPARVQAVASTLNECAVSCRSARLVEERAEEILHADRRKAVHDVMRAMGFSARYNGSDFIAESVLLLQDSPMLIRNLSTQLYKELAQRMGNSPSQIERNMRTAIAAANVDGRITALLGETPTNKRCIRYIANRVSQQA